MCTHRISSSASVLAVSHCRDDTQDYNFRMYALRRTRTGYSEARDLAGDSAAAALAYGRDQLQVLKRQALISQLYPSALSVMEHKDKQVGGILEQSSQ